MSGHPYRTAVKVVPQKPLPVPLRCRLFGHKWYYFFEELLEYGEFITAMCAKEKWFYEPCRRCGSIRPVELTYQYVRFNAGWDLHISMYAGGVFPIYMPR